MLVGTIVAHACATGELHGPELGAVGCGCEKQDKSVDRRGPRGREGLGTGSTRKGCYYWVVSLGIPVHTHGVMGLWQGPRPEFTD